MEFFEEAIEVLVKLVNSMKSENHQSNNAEYDMIHGELIENRLNMSCGLMPVHLIRPPPILALTSSGLGSIYCRT